jgi:hypothetical protein
MAENPDWHRSWLGRAKTAFAKVRASPPPPAQPVEKAVGRASEMVKKAKLEMKGPKAPVIAELPIARQKHQRELAVEHKTARADQKQAEIRHSQRPVIQPEHLKEGARLHEQFKKTAAKNRDIGR